ncbi:MAG: acylphosphatase [FCB group bacterium]|nr:acylphosphatase [FCB group bacterium]
MVAEQTKKGARITITGRVQGVWFRAFARRQAARLDLTGWVQNMFDGSVYCEVEGDKDKIDIFIEKLKRGPEFARVDDVQVEWVPFKGQFDSFEVRY